MLARLYALNRRLFEREPPLEPRLRRPDEVGRASGTRSAPPTPTRGLSGQDQPGRVVMDGASLRTALAMIPETEKVSGRTRSRMAAGFRDAAPPPPPAPPPAPPPNHYQQLAASTSRLAGAFLWGLLDVLKYLVSLLQPVVNALNQARYPRETVAFLLGSLLILAAAALYHRGQSLALAMVEQRHEHAIQLKMLDYLHKCPASGTNESSVLRMGSSVVHLEHGVSSPEARPAPSAPSRVGTCCHVVPSGASAYATHNVDAARRCVDKRLEDDVVGSAYTPSATSTAAAMARADFDRSGAVEGFELAEAVVAALPVSHSGSVTVVQFVRKMCYCP